MMSVGQRSSRFSPSYSEFRRRQEARLARDQSINSNTSTGKDDSSRSKAQQQLTQPITLRVVLEPGKRYRSLTLMSRNRDLPVDFYVVLTLDGRVERVPAGRIYAGDDTMVIVLDARRVGAVELVVSPSPTDRFFSVNEIWASPL